MRPAQHNLVFALALALALAACGPRPPMMVPSGILSPSRPSSGSPAVSTIGMREGIIDLNEVRDLSFEPMLIGSPVPLKYVRWARNDAKLDPVARTEIDGLAERMNVNPGIKVEIGVHSDSRDGAESAKLDQKRADAAAGQPPAAPPLPTLEKVSAAHGGSRWTHCLS